VIPFFMAGEPLLHAGRTPAPGLEHPFSTRGEPVLQGRRKGWDREKNTARTPETPGSTTEDLGKDPSGVTPGVSGVLAVIRKSPVISGQ
jgi:hypothetical protein